MWFVGKSELLSLIERHCLDEVMPAFSDHRTVRKNTTIYKPEDLSNHVYLLKSGSVRLFRLTEDGQEITLSFIKAGMLFGDGDVLNEANYSHHAQTLAPSMICYIRKADFKQLLARYDVINEFVLRSHYLRWQEAQQLIENLSLHDVRKRLTMHERKIVLTPLFVAKFLRNKLPPKQIMLPASFTAPPLNVQAVKAPLARV
jgi:CRP/FNR family cyclic AMP-dependent transcriptional regulator